MSGRLEKVSEDMVNDLKMFSLFLFTHLKCEQNKNVSCQLPSWAGSSLLGGSGHSQLEKQRNSLLCGSAAQLKMTLAKGQMLRLWGALPFSNGLVFYGFFP